MKRVQLTPLAASLLFVLICAPAFARPKIVTVRVRSQSEAPGYEGFKAMDRDPRTMWHTKWGDDETRHPHDLVVDLGGRYEISGFGYLPRNDGSQNGTIRDFEISVSENGKDFGEPEWPELSFQDLLRIAFRDFYIESRDHPVLQQLRGEA